MKVLLACSDRCYLKWAKNPFVGRLLTPVLMTARLMAGYTAMDNFAFTRWDEKKFFRMLMVHSPCSDFVKWVAVPDTVSDWRDTNAKFDRYSEKIQGLGYDLAYVAQDGVTRYRIPWRDIACLFVGGTDDFKLSDHAQTICKKARDKGKWVHVGRVNSTHRVEKFSGVADTFDGMSYSRYGDTHLPNLLKRLKELSE